MAEDFSNEVKAQAMRKLKAQASGNGTLWSGFGMFGLIGWSVAIPTFLGALLGLWLDERHGETHSWTLALLVAGLVIGCWNAGYWVAKEEKAMLEEEAKDE